jgi:signal peptidase I
VPEDHVVGRAFAVVWPPSRFGLLPIPATFLTPGLDSSTGGLPMAPVVIVVALIVIAVALWWYLRSSRRRTSTRE